MTGFGLQAFAPDLARNEFKLIFSALFALPNCPIACSRIPTAKTPNIRLVSLVDLIGELFWPFTHLQTGRQANSEKCNGSEAQKAMPDAGSSGSQFMVRTCIISPALRGGG